MVSSPDSPIDHHRLPGNFNQLLDLGLVVKSQSAGRFAVSPEGEQYLMAVDAHERGEL